MANELKIYGASDGLVEVEGAISDEFGVAADGRWEGKLIHPDNGDGLRVIAAYTSNGTWGVGVAPLDEDAFLPAWPIRITNAADNNYSAMLVIEVPDGVTLSEVEL